MAFKDYSLTPASNTTLGDDTFIGPNMLRNKVRPAFQQLAADGKALSNDLAALVLSGGVAGVGSFNGRAGGVTLSSADVTGALGYAPQTATGPATPSVAGTMSAADKRKSDNTVIAVVVGDGITNDTPAIQAAGDSLGAFGGTVLIPQGMRCLVDTSLTIKPNVALVGSHKFVGSPLNNSVANYAALGGALIVNSAVSIVMKGGSSLRGLLIYRKGMTFPAANASAYLGTAITATDIDDPSVTNCLIMGFAQGFKSLRCQRPRLTDNNWDNTANIHIETCYDVPYVTRNHGWPFATISNGLAITTAIRSGVHIKLSASVDWAKLTDNFSFGYFRNIQLADVNQTMILSNSGDNAFTGVPVHPNSIGIEILGECEDTTIIGAQAAAQATAGIRVATTANRHTLIQGFSNWGGAVHSVLIDSGDATVLGNRLRDATYGVTINNGVSKVLIDKNAFRGISGSPILMLVANPNVKVGDNTYGGFAGANVVGNPANLIAATIASAGGVQLIHEVDDYIVTGIVNIGTVQGGYKGRTVAAYAPSGFSIIHSTTNGDSISTKTLADVAIAAGTLFMLRHDGTQWRLVY